MAIKGAETLWSDPSAFRLEVRLAAVQTASLGESELASALAYEVEPFSHIPSAEAEIAWREIAGEDATLKIFNIAERRLGKGGRGRAGRGKRDAVAFAKGAYVFGALVAVAMAVDFAFLHFNAGAFEESIAKQRPLDAEIKRIEGAANASRAEAEALRTRREDAAKAQEKVARLRSAYPSLMDAIARVCGGKTVVRSFAAGEAFTVEMRSVAANAQEAAAVMAELSKACGAIGWALEPGDMIAAPSATTVEFACKLKFTSNRD